MEEKELFQLMPKQSTHFTSLSRTGASNATVLKADSPSRKMGVKNVPSISKGDDLEELDEDDDGDEIVQEIECVVDDTDGISDPIASSPLWIMDWGDLDQERRNNRKRPIPEDLPEDVREELASMGGAEADLRPKQKPKLDPPDVPKDYSKERKSPVEDEGTAEISVVFTKPAKTAEERLVVLEARDKLIRIRRSQQLCPQLKNLGKCPDMCPEKERYQRIARHQVEYYEFNRETREVNPACMVKIYARSSADQQMPLPHDLRPVNVLWMTMSYLVNQFMDLVDAPGENLGEWYHFLWDRTRSIRKDITQLALCDTVSVQILEMCARFHIFCMERLREEKMAVFDEKINRENLTKCLQSLQYMYNDLFLKNISCPNEPEFQAYSILLHINSDMCTSTILGLRPEMRKHERVQFAINEFLAVSMKNYVRFFKLVKSTSYLNACILHQYFSQVRAHAMHSIIRAYSRQKMRNLYPLSELQEQLLFDSIEDVLEFCQFSKVPVEDNNVVLEKKSSHPIPMQERVKRSFAGVECKRKSSVREIVAGGCQLANTAIFHKVHDSFDEQGFLKQEAWYAEDQEISSESVEMQDVELNCQSAPSTSHTDEIHIPKSRVNINQKSTSVASEISNSSPTALSENVLKIGEKLKRSVAPNPIQGQENGKLCSGSDMIRPSIHSSSHPREQSSLNANSFVFRLPTSRQQHKDEIQKQAQSGFSSHTAQSIFGNTGGSCISGTPADQKHALNRLETGSVTSFQSAQTSSHSLSQKETSTFNISHSTPVQKSTTGYASSQKNTFDFPVSSKTMSKPYNEADHFWETTVTKSPSQALSSDFTSSSVKSLYDSTSNTVPSVIGHSSQTTKPVENNKPFISSKDSQKSCSNYYMDFASSVCSQPHLLITNPLPDSKASSVSTPIFGLHSQPLTTQNFQSNLSTAPALPHINVPVPVSSAVSHMFCESMISTQSKADKNEKVYAKCTSATETAQVDSSLSAFVRVTSSNISQSFIDTKLLSNEKSKPHSESYTSSPMKADKFVHQENTNLLPIKPKQFEELKSSQFMAQSSKTLTTQTISRENEYINKKLDSNKTFRINQLVSNIFYHWRLLSYRSKLKRKMQSQVCCIPLGTNLSLEEQVNEFPIPRGCAPLNYQTRLGYLSELGEIKVPLTVFPEIDKIKLEDILCSVLPNALLEKGRLEKNMFWKLCISLPSELEGAKFSIQLNDWATSTFSDEKSEQECSLLRVSRTHLGEEYNLFSSVQKIVGQTSDHLKGVNGLLFFTSQNITSHEATLARFRKVLDSTTTYFPIPLVVVVCNSQWVEKCQEWFTYDKMKKCISSFKIIGPFNQDKENLSKEIKCSISWLANQVNPVSPLEKWPLREVLLTVLADLWTHVRFTLKGRCSSGFLQHPQDLLGLYHDALKRLENMIVNDQLDIFSETASELEQLAKQVLGDKFTCNALLKSADYFKKIQGCFAHLQLNVNLPSIELLSVNTFCEAVCSFNPTLRAPASHFLCSWNEGDDVDWTYVIEAFVNLHVRDTIGKLKLRNVVILFHKDKIQKFRLEPWYSIWLKDRIPYRVTDNVISENNKPEDSPEQDLCVIDNEKLESKLSYSEEKFLSDFESMLSELEDLNKTESSVEPNCKFWSVNSSSETVNNKNELDFFETQLEHYESFFKE